MFVRRLVKALVLNAVVFGGTLFGLAGTFDWWRAWVYLGVVMIGMSTIMLTVMRPRPELMNERFKGMFQRGQPKSDRIIMLVFLIGYAAVVVLTPLDVFHFHWFGRPTAAVSSLGLLLVIAGYWVVAIVLQQNAFAVPVVRHQPERQQVVVDSGIYAIVRHPMYVGVIMLLVGMPLWLESYAAALLALVPSAALVVRILFEERFLNRELAGYREYTARVRHRLVPYVW